MLADNRPVFAKRNGFKARMAKIQALNALNTPEARAERKRMNDRVYRRGGMNLNGFFHPGGKSPVRCK